MSLILNPCLWTLHGSRPLWGFPVKSFLTTKITPTSGYNYSRWVFKARSFCSIVILHIYYCCSIKFPRNDEWKSLLYFSKTNKWPKSPIALTLITMHIYCRTTNNTHICSRHQQEKQKVSRKYFYELCHYTSLLLSLPPTLQKYLLETGPRVIVCFFISQTPSQVQWQGSQTRRAILLYWGQSSHLIQFCKLAHFCRIILQSLSLTLAIRWKKTSWWRKLLLGQRW